MILDEMYRLVQYLGVFEANQQAEHPLEDRAAAPPSFDAHDTFN
jgi:hypothetical protein